MVKPFLQEVSERESGLGEEGELPPLVMVVAPRQNDQWAPLKSLVRNSERTQKREKLMQNRKIGLCGTVICYLDSR